MSDEAEKEITLTEEEKETAGRLYDEARKAIRELTNLAAKALERTNGVPPKAVNRLVVAKVETIRECDGNGICYCTTRDAKGVPHIRLC